MLKYLLPAAGGAIVALLASSPANALTMKECSAKYQAAKDAGALGDVKWNDFRKSQCGDAAEAAAPAKPAKKEAAATEEAKGLSMKECSAKYQAAKDAGTLGDVKWNDFRKTQCSADSAAAPAAPAKKTAAASEAKGLSMKECSARYQNAKAAGTLGSLKWNDFRKTQCGADDDDTVPAIDEASYTREPEISVAAAPRGVTFPRTVARKFASETPAKQRMRTCLESYYDNKDNGTLNGLRWIQKGGGSYSLCNQRLKAGS